MTAGHPSGAPGRHLAWTNRDRSTTSRTIGFWAAAAGVLRGAWIPRDPEFAVLATTIVGAIVGAKLTSTLTPTG